MPSERSPPFLPILLILSCDIETNPGTTHTYPSCNCPITNHQHSLQCNNHKCALWSHFTIKCAGIKCNMGRPQWWVCIKCDPTHNTPTNNTTPPNLASHNPPPQTTPPAFPTPSPPKPQIIKRESPLTDILSPFHAKPAPSHTNGNWVLIPFPSCGKWMQVG